MDRMFGECSKLITIKGLNKLNTSNVQFMRLMFISDTSLKSLDLSSFDTQNCIDTSQMFRACYNLKSIYVSDTFVMTKVYNSTQMFLNCISLIGGAGTTFDPSFIDGAAARIDGGVSNPGYFTSISDKPLKTPQTNEADMSETTGDEVRNVEAPAKEPDELETDSKQNESESQQ